MDLSVQQEPRLHGGCFRHSHLDFMSKEKCIGRREKFQMLKFLTFLVFIKGNRYIILKDISDHVIPSFILGKPVLIKLSCNALIIFWTELDNKYYDTPWGCSFQLNYTTCYNVLDFKGSMWKRNINGCKWQFAYRGSFREFLSLSDMCKGW